VAWAKRLRRDAADSKRARTGIPNSELAGYDPLVFEILIRSQSNVDGSAEAVWRLLKQMEKAGVEPTPDVYDSIFRVCCNTSSSLAAHAFSAALVFLSLTLASPRRLSPSIRTTN
jgi:hypothetical protein